MTQEEIAKLHQRIDKKALTDIVSCFRLYKIDFTSLPRDMRMAVIGVYVSFIS